MLKVSYSNTENFVINGLVFLLLQDIKDHKII